MKTLRLFLILTFLSHYLGAQELSPEADHLVWAVDSLYDVNSNVLQVYSCSFETSGNAVKWLQNNSTYITEFVVTSADGDWDNVANNGSLTYNVQFMERTGKIIVSRESSKVSMQLIFLEGTENTMPFKFNVTGVALKNP